MEPKSYLDLYPEFVLPPDQKKAFLPGPQGVCCRAGNWRINTAGKSATSSPCSGTIFPGQWEFVLRGIYKGAEKSTEERVLLFHWDYLNESLKKTVPRRADQVGFYMIEVAKPELAAEVSLAVDSIFKNSLAETLTETEKAFQMSFISMTEAIMVAIQIVSYVVIVIIMVVAANTMAMTARERIVEYATLKTLGFGVMHIAATVFGESLLISGLGGVMGALLSFPAAHWIETELAQFFPSFTVSPLTIGLEIGAALLVGIVAGIFPTWRGATIPVAEGLRRIG